MTTDPTIQEQLLPTADQRRTRWYSRRWTQLAGVAVLALTIGGGIGGAGTSQANSRAAAAEKVANAAKQGTVQAQNDAEGFRQESNTAAARAEAGVKAQKDAFDAEQKRQKDEFAAQMTQQQAALASRTSAVVAREKTVGGAEVAAKANRFAGEGTYLVGTDIKPGTYKAAANSGCYWARLSSLNTSDIIDNNNSDGPVVIEVRSTDKALEVAGCAEFNKVG